MYVCPYSARGSACVLCVPCLSSHMHHYLATGVLLLLLVSPGVRALH